METTFVPNMRLPVHRWFRYSAGFSARWAASRIEAGQRVLDPFVGSGTTALAAEERGARGIGLEAHPFVLRVARAKLAWRSEPAALRARAALLLERAAATGAIEGIDDEPELLQRCYPPETLARLLALRRAWEEADDGSPASELCWLALAAILRRCSPAGTAPWQYVLPARRKRRTAEPLAAFTEQVEAMAQDMEAGDRSTPPARVIAGDARECAGLEDGSIDAVICSPPYANNFDYADATRLEMTFFGQVRRWGDLQEAVRRHLVRSCSQHVSRAPVDELVAAPGLAPIRDELAAVCAALGEQRRSRKGRKAYDAMVAAYFGDMARCWGALRRVCREGASVCFVVGDSAPYGVHVPVERWLGELAAASGFGDWTFEQTRQRNTKWRNRKHRVLLKEGWLELRG
jgi:DNA modification methylase